jgi:hypothetical protein
MGRTAATVAITRCGGSTVSGSKPGSGERCLAKLNRIAAFVGLARILSGFAANVRLSK